MQTVIGVFNNANDAQQALSILENMGYSPHQISITTSTSEQLVGTKGGTTARSSNATRGLVTGAIAGLLLGIAAVNVPGIGIFTPANPLTAALGLSAVVEIILTSTFIGAIVGFLLGALLGLGTKQNALPDPHQIMGQSVVLAVPATLGDHAEYVRNIFEQYHAGQIRSVSA